MKTKVTKFLKLAKFSYPSNVKLKGIDSYTVTEHTKQQVSVTPYKIEFKKRQLG